MWISDSTALRSHLSATHHENPHGISSAQPKFSVGIQLPRFSLHERDHPLSNRVVVSRVSDWIVVSERLDTQSRVPDTSNHQKDNARLIKERFTHMNTLTKSLAFIAVLAGCIASTPARLNAQSEAHRVRNIVLVHGAWADGSGWKGVYNILTKDGYNVSIVQEPETSFTDDVAATKRILTLQDGPSILVAHSYGGAVITEAGTEPS